MKILPHTHESTQCDSAPSFQELHAAMRRAGQNPTEAEVQDMINEVDVDGSGYLEFPEFCMMMHKKLNEGDQENDLKEVFRVFGKDETGEEGTININYVIIQN